LPIRLNWVKGCAHRRTSPSPRSGHSPTGSEFQNVFRAAATTRGRCSSCYPCSAPQGRHHLTLAVTARKRARPLSKSGRLRPKCGSGCAPFQIVSVGLFHGFSS
jgi:hypothetical protein